MSLDGRLVVVTGASRGIGRAVAERAAQAGARLALCARNGDAVERVAEAIRQAGGEALAAACDVSSPREVARFAEALAGLGAPDALINNAGVVARARLDEMSVEAWDEVVGVNLRGAFLMTRAFLPAMRARRAGRIINVSSISGRQGTARLTAYCAAKHGLVGLTRALAEETREDGIQVNAVCPGSVDTEMLKGSGFPPAMSAGDVAGVILYLAAAAPPAMTGACVDVFG
jgi:3-oxoacyl-[acyl-carrier protein] reductase